MRRSSYYTHPAARPQQSASTSIKHMSYTPSRTATPLSSSAASLSKLGSSTKSYSRLPSATASPSRPYTQSASRVTSRVLTPSTASTASGVSGVSGGRMCGMGVMA